MTVPTCDDLFPLKKVYGNCYTLKQILSSENGEFGCSYQSMTSESLDRFLSEHVIAFTNENAWNDGHLRRYVRNEAYITHAALYDELKKQKRCSYFMAIQSLAYFTANRDHFQRLFSLLDPSRRSLFCFILVNPLYLSLGHSTFLQVSGPSTFEEGQVEGNQRATPDFAETFINKSDILINDRMVKKGSFSHRLPKSFNYIKINQMLYDHSNKRTHSFIHRYDYVDSIRLSIFGSVIPEKAQFGQYRDLFESIKLNHMKFDFKKTLDLVAGKEQVTRKSSLKSLVTSHVTHDKVCEFMRRVFFATFPRLLFGSNQNRQKFYRGLKLIITSSRASIIRTSNVSRGLNYKVIPWLHGDRKHPSQGQFLEFSEFVIEYILDLLGSFFYVTETQYSNLQNVFYRKKTWKRIYKLALENMGEEQGEWCTRSSLSTGELTSMPTLSLLNQSENEPQSDGQHKIVNRVIPKKSSVRIIEPNKSVDLDKLRAMKAIIRSMRRLQTSRQRNEDFSRLIHWCQSMSLAGRFIYFIRSDIRDCYPSIDHNLLLSIVRGQMVELFSQERPEFIDVFVLDVFTVDQSRRFTRRVFIPRFERRNQFLKCLRIVSGTARNRLIIPKRIVKLTRPYDCIFEQVVGNFIPVSGDKCFKLIKGLRQGDPISSDLSSLYIEHYLDEMTRDLVSSDTEDCKFMSSHSADDMIFACIDNDHALALLARITHFSNQFNLTVNLKKVQINFSSQGICPEITMSDCINYHGFKINSCPLALHGDYSYLRNSHIRYSFDSNQFRPLTEFLSHIKRQVTTISVLLIDPFLNSFENIAINLYEKIYFQGVRLAYYLLASPVYRVKQVPCRLLAFVLSAVRRVYQRNTFLPDKNLPLSHLQVTCIALSSLLYLWTNNSRLFCRKSERSYLQGHLNQLMKQDSQLAVFLDLSPSDDLLSVIFTH